MGVLGKKAAKQDTTSTDRDIPTEGSGLWEDAPYDFTRRCVCMEVYGDTDTGRSTLALTVPFSLWRSSGPSPGSSYTLRSSGR